VCLSSRLTVCSVLNTELCVCFPVGLGGARRGGACPGPGPCLNTRLSPSGRSCEERTSSVGGSGTMASPFVPVPMPMERGPPPCGGAGKARRPQRASSLGSVSVNGGGGGGGGAESSPSAEGGTLPGRDSARAGQERGRTGPEGGTRAASGTPPPPTHHSPSPRVRVNGGGPGGGPGGGGGGLEPSVEYSTCPRSASDLPAGARPFTPTLLGYEVMEERAKFTVQIHPFTGSPVHSFTHVFYAFYFCIGFIGFIHHILKTFYDSSVLFLPPL